MKIRTGRSFFKEEPLSKQILIQQQLKKLIEEWAILMAENEDLKQELKSLDIDIPDSDKELLKMSYFESKIPSLPDKQQVLAWAGYCELLIDENNELGAILDENDEGMSPK